VLGSALRCARPGVPEVLRMTDTKSPPERRVVLPVDPTRRTEIDKQRVPMSARPYRLLALVKQDAVVRVQKEPDDTVMTWPHLLTIEFLAAAAMSVFLLMMGLIVNAPLEELANPNVTPEIAKAPWYFLGLQELLAYFHPSVAGALVPVFVLVGAALIPFIDRGNLTAVRPSDRKTTVLLFTIFCAFGLVLTFLGIFFRGPGYAFTLPWVDGFFFSL
jgi:quinol-cytochrome oxidoreductase complex cytochrome b subunit